MSALSKLSIFNALIVAFLLATCPILAQDSCRKYFSRSERFTFAADQSELSLESQTHRRIVQIAYAMEAWEQKGRIRTPPPAIFHVGGRKVLFENIQQGQIPKDIWDHFIMGDGSSYVLPSWRKGFYGADHPIRALYYGGESIAHRKEAPWVSVLVLKPEVKRLENYTSEHIGPKNVRFMNWLKENYQRLGFKSFEELCAECIKGPAYMNDIGQLGIRGQQASAPYIESRCSKAIDLVFRDWGIQIAYDSRFSGSWYFRNRDAISEIRGTPAEILHLMTTDFYWRRDPGEYGFVAVFSMTLQILAGLPEIPKPTALQVLRAIRSRLSKLDPDDGYEDAWIKPLWEAQAELVESYIKKQEAGQLEEYKKSLQDYHQNHLMQITGNYKFAQPPNLNELLTRIRQNP